MFKEMYQNYCSLYSPERFRKETEELNRLEVRCSHCDFDKSTRYVMDLLKDAGFEDIERYELKADGVTSAGDAVMPEAWDLTGHCTLEVLSDWDTGLSRIIADTDETPLAASTWCGSTPPEGLTGELTFFDPAHPENAKGKWVFWDGLPGGNVNRPAMEAGALGIVSTDFIQGELDPDATRWMNGQGYWGWYYLKGEKRLPIFAITTRRASILKKKLEAGEKVILKGIMNTRYYDGVIYTVTARIPGETEEECAMFAHMYEPFLSDDASGVAASIEAGRMLKASGAKLKKSFRVVFSMEHYGFIEYILNRNRGRIKAALNMDTTVVIMYRDHHYPLEWRLSTAAMPFFGDLVMPRIIEEVEPDLRLVPVYGTLSDDTFAGEPLYGIPTNWLNVSVDPYHHSTAVAFGDVDWELAGKVICLTTTYMDFLAGASADQWKKLLPSLERIAVRELHMYTGKDAYDYHCRCDFAYQQLAALNNWIPGIGADPDEALRFFRMHDHAQSPVPANPAEEKASRIVVTRLEKGTPWSLARIPTAEKRKFELRWNPVLHALLDGKRNLLEAIRITQYTKNSEVLSEREVEVLIEMLQYLEKYGYVKIAYQN